MKVHEFSRIRDVLTQTLQSLLENRRLSMLSLSSTVIATATVICTLTISNSLQDKVFKEIESYGLSTFWVYSKHNSKTKLGSGIQNSDFEYLKNNCCADVLKISPEVYFENWEVLVKTDDTIGFVVMEGVGRQFLDISRAHLDLGRNFTASDIKNKSQVTLIGSGVRKTLFGIKNPVGKIIQFEDLQLVVIGLLKEKKRNILSLIGAREKFDINNRILIPYSLHQQLSGSKDINALKIEANQQRIPSAQNQIIKVLKHRHNKSFMYESESLEKWTKTLDRIFKNVSLIGAALATIFFVGAALGIRAIIDKSVIQGRQEIGIRKMIGASDQEIFFQFGLQAVMICAIGGLFGALLTFTIGIIITFSSGLPVTPTSFTLMCTTTLAMTVGLIAGYKPAKEAANINPTEILQL